MVITNDLLQKSPLLIPHLLVHLHEVGTHGLKVYSSEDQLPVKRNHLMMIWWGWWWTDDDDADNDKMIRFNDDVELTRVSLINQMEIM